jgi:hypothetical protein
VTFTAVQLLCGWQKSQLATLEENLA